MPVILTGIHYLNNSSIPNRGDRYAGDNEMAHGLLDIIELHNGRPANLASRDFGAMLVKLETFRTLP